MTKKKTEEYIRTSVYVNDHPDFGKETQPVDQKPYEPDTTPDKPLFSAKLGPGCIELALAAIVLIGAALLFCQ